MSLGILLRLILEVCSLDSRESGYRQAEIIGDRANTSSAGELFQISSAQAVSKRCAVAVGFLINFVGAALKKGIKSFQNSYGDPVLLRYEVRVVADAL